MMIPNNCNDRLHPVPHKPYPDEAQKFGNLSTWCTTATTGTFWSSFPHLFNVLLMFSRQDYKQQPNLENIKLV